MNEVEKIQKDHFSKEDSAHTKTNDYEDLENYIDHVEKAYHSARKAEWLKAYKKNYLNTHKDQVKIRGSDLD